MYLQDFLFLDDQSTVTTSNTLIVNSKAETMKLSVEGNSTIDVTVKGKVNRDSADFYELGAIKLADFGTVASISEAGLYAVDVQGIKELQIVNGGNAGDVTVFGVVVG